MLGYHGVKEETLGWFTSFLAYGDFLPLRELSHFHTENGAKLSLSVAEDMLILTTSIWSHDYPA